MGGIRRRKYPSRGKGLTLILLAVVGFLSGMGLSALMDRGRERGEVRPIPPLPEEAMIASTPKEKELPGPSLSEGGQLSPERRSSKRGFPKEEHPSISVIVDDLGWDRMAFERITELKIPLTLAVLPFEKDSPWMAEMAMGRGFEVIVHLPMEPKNGTGLQAGLSFLRVNMGQEAISNAVELMLRRIPQAVGANNHMGSLFTENFRGMEAVADILAKRKLYFVDSLTTPRSVGYEVAHQKGLRAYRRDVFLDARRGEDEIRKSFQELLWVARHKGYALGICHPYPETLRVLPELYRESSGCGVKWVHVSQLPDNREEPRWREGDLHMAEKREFQ